MDSEQFKRVKELFYEALERKSEERSAFLDEACEDDLELRKKVEQLLIRSMQDEEFMEPMLSLRVNARESEESLSPTRIGQFLLKDIISSGGMGTVYEAIQEHPHRTVALKVMRTGIASKSTLRRFEYEAQILANLRHPNIAQVYEAGTHFEGNEEKTAGVPYFAMEYIPQARAITEYAREKELTIRERLVLFMQVCDAVHHGHQKGIIHRDLKPGNLLVDPQGQVKIIDFGIARATDSDVALTTQHTDVGQLIGTVQYMSPEQCLADPYNLDTRSDVYALGIVLYELLCERLPYDVQNVAVFEATRIIREEQPRRPSTTDRALKGDVETIILKSLDKDRERRYPSAESFRRDIDHYLKNEPIKARPPSVVYQFRSFARRHKTMVLGTAVVFMILVGASIISTTMYIRADNQRVIAEAAETDAFRETVRAEKINDFFSEMLASMDPIQLPWVPDISVVNDKTFISYKGGVADDYLAVTIRHRIPEIDIIFEGKPELEAGIRETVGSLLLGLGQLKEAEVQLIKAVDLNRSLFGDNHETTLRSKFRLGTLLRYGGSDSLDYPREAEVLLRQTFDELKGDFGDLHPNTLNCASLLACSLYIQGKHDDAEPLFRKTLEAQLGLHEDDIRPTLVTMIGWFSSLFLQQRVIEAEEVLRKAYEWGQEKLPENDFFMMRLKGWMSYVLVYRGKYEEAERLASEAYEMSRNTLGERHFQTHGMKAFLALSLKGENKHALKKQLFSEAVEGLRETLGDHSGWTTIPSYYFITFLQDQGWTDAAETELRRWIKIEYALIREGRFSIYVSLPYLIRVIQNSADNALMREFSSETIRLGRECLQNPSATPDELDSFALFLMNCNQEDLCDIDAAIEYATRATGSFDAQDYYHPYRVDTLAKAYLMKGDYKRALELQQKAIDAVPAGDRRSLRWSLERRLSLFLFRAGNEEEAMKVLHDSIDRCRDALGADNPYYANRLSQDVLMLIQEARFGQAEPLARECLNIFQNASKDAFQEVAYAKILLGACLAGLGNFEKAEDLLLQGYAVIKDNPMTRPQKMLTIQFLIKLYEAWKKPERAAGWRSRLLGGPTDSAGMEKNKNK